MKLVWTIDLTQDENGINVANAVPYDESTEKFLTQIPSAQDVADLMIGSFSTAPLEGNLFNAAAGMKLVGDDCELLIKGANNVKM
jgi:hypothetical protein